MSLSNLPPEICFIVFKHVESLKTVAECRLVCKTWNPLAERAMFSKPLSLVDRKKLIKFCNRLQQNPSLRHYIRFLSFSSLRNGPVKVNKDLFKLFMNPNIVSIGGWLDETCWIDLVNAVKESGEQCKKLEALKTQFALVGGDNYLNAQFFFKASLRELHLSSQIHDKSIYQNVVNNLDQFSNLERLVLLGPYTLLELERMLRQCQHLGSICFDESFIRRPWVSNNREWKQWMTSNVQQSSSLMTTNVSHNLDSQLVEFLLFKFPNTRKVTLANGGPRNGGMRYMESVGVLDAVKNVDFINLEHWGSYTLRGIDHTLSTLKNKNNVVILRPCSPHVEEICLDAKKNKDDNTTHWKICIPGRIFSNIFSRIIQDIASHPKLKVDFVDEDVMLIERGEVPQGNATFKRLIDIMSVAMDVCFTCTYISCPSVLEVLPFNQLETLKICGAVIDPNVLTLISRNTPRLKNLTLNTCILNPTGPQQYQIDMPHTNFDTLSIISRRSIWESYCIKDTEVASEKQNAAIKKIDTKISIKQNQMVFVKVICESGNLVEHYNLKPGNPAIIKVVSQDEYSAWAPGWPNVTIACKSLNTLKLDLGALFVELKLDTSHSRRSMEAALLKDLYYY